MSASRYECSCGYEAASATTFHRHLRLYKDREEAHHRVPPGDKPATQPQPADESAERAEPAAGLFTRLSAVGGLASSLWATASPALPAEDARSPEDGGSADEAELDRRTRAERLASGPVWDLDSDEYSEITRSLLSVDAAAGAADTGKGRAAAQRGHDAGRILASWSSIEEEAATGGGEPGSAARAPARVTAEDLEHVLLWREPGRTARWFLGGLYVLLCLRHLVHGVEIFQPTSALAVAAILAMLVNAGRQLLSRHPRQGWRAGEAALEQRVHGLATRALLRVVPLITAAVSLVARRLSAHSSMGSRIWLALSLWLVVCVGELRWLSQASLAMWLWAALFSLPPAYLACRAALDTLVEECLGFLAAVLRGGQRGTLAAAAGAGVVAFGLADARLYLRLSLAVLAAAGVLLWQAHHLRRRALAASKAA